MSPGWHCGPWVRNQQVLWTAKCAGVSNQDGDVELAVLVWRYWEFIGWSLGIWGKYVNNIDHLRSTRGSRDWIFLLMQLNRDQPWPASLAPIETTYLRPDWSKHTFMILYVEQQPFRVYFREHGETWGPGLGRDMGACWGERSYSGTSETNPRAQARPFTLNISMAPSACSLRLDEKMHCYCQVCSHICLVEQSVVYCYVLRDIKHQWNMHQTKLQICQVCSSTAAAKPCFITNLWSTHLSSPWNGT